MVGSWWFFRQTHEILITMEFRKNQPSSQKYDLGGQKKRQNFVFGHLRQKADQISGQNIPNQKTDCQNLFSYWSYKSLKLEFMCSQIPPL